MWTPAWETGELAFTKLQQLSLRASEIARPMGSYVVERNLGDVTVEIISPPQTLEDARRKPRLFICAVLPGFRLPQRQLLLG